MVIGVDAHSYSKRDNVMLYLVGNDRYSIAVRHDYSLRTSIVPTSLDLNILSPLSRPTTWQRVHCNRVSRCVAMSGNESVSENDPKTKFTSCRWIKMYLVDILNTSHLHRNTLFIYILAGKWINPWKTNDYVSTMAIPGGDRAWMHYGLPISEMFVLTAVSTL